MSLQKLVHTYAGFNTWANEKLVAWLSAIDVPTLHRQMPSSFTSIDHTVQHILRVQRFWTTFVSEKDVSRFDWSVHENQAARILEELKTQSAGMQQVVQGFTENDLLRTLKLDTPWEKNELPRYEYILHAVNHSTYHRGQVITMARNLGINENIPSTDYNFYHSR